MTDIYKTPKTYDSQNPHPKVSWKDYFYASQNIKAKKNKYIPPTVFIVIVAILATIVAIFKDRFDLLSFAAGIATGVAYLSILTAWLWSSLEKFHKWEEMEEAVDSYKHR